MAHRTRLPTVLFLLASVSSGTASAASNYPWLGERAVDETLAARIAPPAGYEPLPATQGSFTAWLRGLPLRPAGTPVRYHDGREKRYQAGAYAVIDVDVGAANLQQCADAVIRLRAEYLRACGCADHVTFDFTSGDRARWTAWRDGARPVVSGSDVTWRPGSARADSSYASFRRYLETVFNYAGSLSLERELLPVDDPAAVLPGDVYIQGGSPGHAVLVADVAVNARGERVFLLVQSYMPAQDVHVLVNPQGAGSPWFTARRGGELVTPEWTFVAGDLRRFGGLCDRD